MVSQRKLILAILQILQNCRRHLSEPETIQLQIHCDCFDMNRERRIMPSVKLPHHVGKIKLLILGDGYEWLNKVTEHSIKIMTEREITKVGKDNKAWKKIAKKYHKIACDSNLIKRIPRLIGPALNRSGKFPFQLPSASNTKQVLDTLDDQLRTFRMITPTNGVSYHAAVIVGNANMPVQHLADNLVVTKYMNLVLRPTLATFTTVKILDTCLGPDKPLAFLLLSF